MTESEKNNQLGRLIDEGKSLREEAVCLKEELAHYAKILRALSWFLERNREGCPVEGEGFNIALDPYKPNVISKVAYPSEEKLRDMMNRKSTTEKRLREIEKYLAERGVEFSK